jgi:hypothetical protein
VPADPLSSRGIVDTIATEHSFGMLRKLVRIIPSSKSAKVSLE